MSNLVYPAYPDYRGLAFTVLRAPEYDTIVQRGPNGVETRVLRLQNPRWHWVLNYNYLKDKPDDIPDELIYTDLNTLLDFILKHKGRYEDFLFRDPDDEYVGPGLIGASPNLKAELQLVQDVITGIWYSPIQRRMGGQFWEDISDLHGVLKIYANGTLQGEDDYIVGGPGLGITGYSFAGLYAQWAVEPTPPITAEFYFYWRVRFESDRQDLDKFMPRLWAIGGDQGEKGEGTVKLVTVRNASPGYAGGYPTPPIPPVEGIDIVTYIELLCCNTSAPARGESGMYAGGPAIETYRVLDPAKYDGDCTYTFEITCHNDMENEPIDIHLRDTDGNTYATITIPSHSDDPWGWYTYRVEFTPPTTAKTVGVHFTPHESDSYLFVTVARIEIAQEGASKSRVQWPMLAFGNSWAVGLSPEFIACSTQVYTNGVYAPNYDGVDPDYSYALDVLPIWKLSAGQLDTISAVEFRALAGRHVGLDRSWMMCWAGLPSPPIGYMGTWWSELYYSDDAGVTKVPIEGTTRSFGYPDSPYPWAWNISLDPSLFEVDGRKFYLYFSPDGGAPIWAEFSGLLLGSAYEFERAEFAGYIGNGGTSPVVENSIMFVGIELYESEAAIQGLSIAVFDRATDTMISGSELTWANAELGTWKSCAISPSNIPIGHELEVRLSSPAANYPTAPYISEAELNFDVDPISVFTSWQRAMKGSVNFGWGYYYWWISGYPTGGQAEYMWDDGGSPYEFGGVSTMSRLKFRETAGSTKRYQTCARSWAYGGYNPANPGIAYEYYALWDDGENDSGCRTGANRIAASMTNWLLGDYAAAERYLKISEEITGLIDGHRYCSLQPDDEYWTTPMDGFLVVTVEVP